MTVTKRKTLDMLHQEVQDILDKHFIDEHNLKNLNTSSYQTHYSREIKQKLNFLERLVTPEIIVAHLGKVIDISYEDKKIKLMSYCKEFTNMACKLEEKLPEYDILIVEDFE